MAGVWSLAALQGRGGAQGGSSGSAREADGADGDHFSNEVSSLLK